MRVHKVTLAVLAVAASLSLTACQGDDDSAGQNSPSSSAAASSSGGSGSADSGQGGATDSAGTDSGGTGGSSGGSSGSTGGSAASGKGSAGSGSGSGSGQSGKAGTCRTDDLTITAKDTSISGEPDGTVTVQLTNRSGRSCTISGYAGVDLKTNAGSVSAQRVGKSTGPSVLKAGQATYFGISYPINDTGGSGVRVTGLLVTPPNETKTVSLAWPGGGSLPVTEGGGSPVKIGPVGSAGQGG
ncbi:DUF4232 domain-containing protein [Streptomyces sp. SID8381]|uniref:DUF4232 domain-containing protein n=1 Tax=unclassified Streptomyces TaxID=2593676 RepID=UPI00037254CE|nr:MULTISPECIES: DUF4232 domain-containing protein [unclassified Streptomyces]MYX30927.1 DUF4232 domain-containing protein [Streptomyces sp. SID8381]